MAAQVATAQYVPAGLNGGNRFFVKSVVPGSIASETFTVTLPDGVPKDALPLGPANVFDLSGDVYTRDADLAAVTTHNRATGVTVYTATGNVSAGAILIQEYVGIG